MPEASEAATPDPDAFYSKAQRKLQTELQTDNLANAVVHAIVRDEMLPEMIGFVSSRDYFSCHQWMQKECRLSPTKAARLVSRML